MPIVQQEIYLYTEKITRLKKNNPNPFLARIVNWTVLCVCACVHQMR